MAKKMDLFRCSVDDDHSAISLRKSNITNRIFVHFETCVGFDPRPESNPYCNHEDKAGCLLWSMWLPFLNPTVVNTVRRAGYCISRMEERKYDKLQGALWDYVDDERAEKELLDLNPELRINRMLGTTSICRKHLLSFNYRWMQEVVEEDEDAVEDDLFDFLPESLNLPDERQELIQRIKQSDHLWIIKPSNMSCGKGIEIAYRWLDLPSKHNKEPTTVQKYIHPPYTIQGRKFDLRLYLLITSISPLRLYLYKEGLVRFATEQYNLNRDTLNNKYIHLTNYAVNQHNPNQAKYIK